ncbi:Arm DNA-binding domain-containing protein [Pseudogulbenkiania subflava]|uniref:Integrase DNA-binding domain-containing protein n=1 Tax=Pseudogulbenkiania subflava DSM 22618 TaxID=1123014 RepID=A0A1Y6BG36_9NEIS|nr:Arm DNA-binding domain-containing protein [Pseudogulbenkiania subflava]SMF02081.1 protein of unknown function [Pseudogulbenkiania subflava DSM 22618]
MPLTDATTKNTKPRENGKPDKLADGDSLFLWVMPNGAKYWRMAYRYAGKQKTLAYGVYPETSLKEAGAKRDAAASCWPMAPPPESSARWRRSAPAWPPAKRPPHQSSNERQHLRES